MARTCAKGFASVCLLLWAAVTFAWAEPPTVPQMLDRKSVV